MDMLSQIRPLCVIFISTFLYCSFSLAATYNFSHSELEKNRIRSLKDKPVFDLDELKIDYAENDNEQYSYSDLIQLLKFGRYSEARNIILKLLNKTPDNPVLYSLFGQLEALERNKLAAQENYLKAIKLNKDNVFAYEQLAKIALSEQKLEQARFYVEKMRAINENYINSYLILAEIDFSEKKYDRTEQSLLLARNLAKSDAAKQIKVLTALGKLYFNQHKTKKILRFMEDLYRRYPENKRVLSLYATNLLVNKQYHKAELVLKKIISLDQLDVVHRLTLAKLIAKDIGRKKEVIALFNKVIELDQKNPDYWILKTSYLLKINDPIQALNSAKSLTKNFPESAKGYQLTGDIYRRVKQTDDAINSYRVALQKDPDSAVVFVLARLLVEQGNVTDAIDLLESRLDKYSNQNMLNFKLGVIYQQIEEYHKAVIYYQRVLNQKPDHILALNNLAWVYAQLSDPQAVKVAEKAYRLSPESAAIADTYGYVLLILGHHQSDYAANALKLIKQAAEALPEIAEIQYHLALAYSMTGDKKKAVKILNTLKKLPVPMPVKLDNKVKRLWLELQVNE